MPKKRDLSRTGRLTVTAACLSLCVLLPYAFHALPNAATVFSPMHIPVLLCALACGWGYGLLCGAAGPVLCFLVTGMPNAAELLPMIGECAVYGLVAGVCMRYIRTGKFYPDCYLSLIAAMLAGRIVGGVLQAFVFSAGNYSFALWATTYFLRGWPAIVIQLVLLPNVLFTLTKVGLLKEKYPKQSPSQEYEEE